MRLLEQIKKDEDVTPSKTLVCIVCGDELGQNNVKVLCDSYTHQTEFYCRECYQVTVKVRQSISGE